jgi:hypothetical protein
MIADAGDCVGEFWSEIPREGKSNGYSLNLCEQAVYR